MPNHSNWKYHEKLLYFQDLINDLHEEEKYLLPVFLLRCQLVEYSLKFLLVNYPFKGSNFSCDEKIEKLTLGQVVKELREIKDSYMDDIVKKAGKLVDMRNDLTHNFIKSDFAMDDINLDIKEKMEFANQIEENIYYYFDYVDNFRKN